MYVIVTVNTLLIKDGASLCYCAYILGILGCSRNSNFLIMVENNILRHFCLICGYVGKGDLSKGYFTAFQNNICLIISEKCVLRSKLISF